MTHYVDITVKRSRLKGRCFSYSLEVKTHIHWGQQYAR